MKPDIDRAMNAGKCSRLRYYYDPKESGSKVKYQEFLATVAQSEGKLSTVAILGYD